MEGRLRDILVSIAPGDINTTAEWAGLTAERGRGRGGQDSEMREGGREFAKSVKSAMMMT